jgi:hypothetical protein
MLSILLLNNSDAAVVPREPRNFINFYNRFNN